jgi:hypothetical protein
MHSNAQTWSQTHPGEGIHPQRWSEAQTEAHVLGMARYGVSGPYVSLR